MDGGDRALLGLVLVDQELALLHLVVRLGVLGGHGVGHGVDAPLRDLHHGGELVADDDVGQQTEDCVLGAFLVFPAQGVGVGADLDGGAYAVAEGVEGIPQALAVVDKKRLMPHVGDRPTGRCAGHEPAAFEVCADFGDGLRPQGGVVFVRGTFINDQVGELLEKRLGLSGQPLDGVGVGDVDVHVLGEGLSTVVGLGHNDTQVGCELAHAVGPDVGHERARADHQGAAATCCSVFGKRP